MTQAIPLPQDTVTEYGNNAISNALAVERINNYAKEVAMVAIILSDNYMKELYESPFGYHSGYIACIDKLHEWAVEFVQTYAHVAEWEEFLSTDRTFGECICWDDFVIAFGSHKIKE